ncbi:vWA domain-containing protein [Paenibacillus sp. N3.4]|uniref:vWA domain-containing protein n=1 Tax=Paenibacillus sp. N3.4 TaxID=2603222 RepID=UPI0011C85616|nr:vWA domain-containing protein [Paenibacillus sp. N3.4]TXK78275.1 VWA domain-containing protein [Paenibacillus sp. N3.4]
MKQILLITDGCSNVGVSPVIAAAQAHAEGVVVNVIGVIDHGELGVLGSEEIREIADAGGGMSRIVDSSQLSQTVQMMTRKTVSSTIQQAVGKEMQSILGHGHLEQLPPQQRAEVVQVIDAMSETTSLRVALLIDASASMKPKLAAVREAIHDLLLSLRARSGKSELAVFHFPSTKSRDQELEMDLNWTNQLANLDKMFYKINMKGTTPTGPALLQTLQFVTDKPISQPAEGGMLSDYVV